MSRMLVPQQMDENAMYMQNMFTENMVVQNPKAYLERKEEQAESLSRSKWARYCEGLDDGHVRRQIAMMLENTDGYLKNFDETTRAQQIGNFDKFAFPLIRAIFPNTIAQEIVSVQAMPGPISLIFYLDFLFGSSKGQIQAGQSAFDAISGPVDVRNYSSEDIENEVFATAPGAPTVTFPGTLAYLPVQPGTFQIQAGNIVGFDDGNGTIAGTGIVAGTIDYNTGQVTITYAVAPAINTLITCTYRYDSEGNPNIPMVDLQLVSSPVVARHRKLRQRWSIEAQASLKTLHGLDAQAELAGFTAEEIKFEIDREVINDLYTVAMAGHVNWSITVPAGVSYTEHKLSFVDAVIELGNLIFTATRRGQANFLVLSVDVANVVEALPTFVADPQALQTQKSTGVVKIGVLNNRWTCYKDPFLGAGMTNRRIFFGGYKGGSFLDAGWSLN